MRYYLAILALAMFLPGTPLRPTAFAQESAVDIESPAKIKRGKKRRRKRRKSKRNRTPDANSLTKDAQEEAVAEKIKDKIKSAMFPNWGTPEFSWYLDPIIGLRFTKNTNDTGTTDTVTSEIGAAIGLNGVPVIPLNPGLFLSPSVGKAWGSVDSKFGGETTSVKYQRTFGALQFTVPIYWYRHTLKISRGVKEYSVDTFSKLQSFSVMNDFAVLFVPWISGHLTHTYLKAFQNKFSEPALLENDYWLHGRFATSILSFYIDLGPGFTVTKEYSLADGTHQEVANGQIDYFKFLTGLHLFWKFGMTGQAKYIYKTTDNNLGQYASQLLPDEGLNKPREQSMPEDSLAASLFLGARNIIAGLGFGWQYNLQILNMSEKDGKKKETTKDQGYTFTYDVSY